MTSVGELVARLQERGVRLEPRPGGKLAVRPVDRVSADELETLRARKVEVLALLAPPTLPALDPETVCAVLGPKPDPHHVAMIAFDVFDAVRAIEAEIATGVIAAGTRLVEGRPLGDWLDLGDVARLLRDRRTA